MKDPTELFTGVIPFVRVAELLSFRRAAEGLGVSTAAVSKSVSRLEARLEVKLLSRSSRAVVLTPEGRLFLARGKEAIASLEHGHTQLTRSRTQPRGDIRVSASPILGPLVVAGLPRLIASYPELVVHLELSDHIRGLITEDIDVALRVGARTSSGLISRVLRRPRWVTVVAPSYLARRVRPLHPRDLADHDCVRFVDPRGRPVPWWFGDAPLEVTGTLLVNQGNLLLDAALAGVGVVQVLDLMLGEMVRDGRLLEILAEHACEGPLIHAVTTPERQRSANVRAFLDHAVAAFGA
jgi:LysR family transcriptional regulator, regulator for bpeEF and oprC